MLASRLAGSTLRPKTNLDLLVEVDGFKVAIELKVPLNGQHPETIYSFCADLEFVEAIKRAEMANSGYCVMATPDGAFWRDSGRGSPIHNLFRAPGEVLSGTIGKPTGAKDSCVVLQQSYVASEAWRDLDNRLLERGRYLLVEV
jgi:hypothetical protein